MRYIYLHGFSSGSNSHKGTFFKKKFHEKGIVLETPDLNGNDFEHLTLSRQLKELAKMIGADSGPITLIGSSLGGYLAAIAAQKYSQIQQMVLIAPAFNFATRFLSRLPAEQLEQWKKEGYLEVYHYGYQEARKIHFGIIEDGLTFEKVPLNRKLPALLFHGIEDESVPYEVSISYLKQNPLARLILLPADHGMGEQVELLWEYTSSFLKI